MRALFENDPAFSISSDPSDTNKVQIVLHSRHIASLAQSNGGGGGSSRGTAAALGARQHGGFGGGGGGGGHGGVPAGARDPRFEDDEETRDLMAACDVIWPRVRHRPGNVLRNELAKQMIRGLGPMHSKVRVCDLV